MIAHISKDGRIQTLAEHCRHTAELCANALKSIGLEKCGWFVGMIHDMGKARKLFESYIEKAVAGEYVVRGSVNHTFCAVCVILENCDGYNAMQKLSAEMLAWAVGSHHGEFDCFNTDKKSGFQHRLEYDRNEIGFDEASTNFYAECFSEEEVRKAQQEAICELTDMLKNLRNNCGNYTNVNGKRISAMTFISGQIARLILSALIDADRRDTADFEAGCKAIFLNAGEDFWKDESDNIKEKLDLMADGQNGKAHINQVRRMISDEAFQFAGHCKSGVFRLTVPTGSGKTLTAMRYAFEVCRKYGKKGCFFVIPLLSVLDQNVKVIKDTMKNSDVVEEHHSNIIKTDMTKDELDRFELAAETWNNPIIVTTLVQLLNTLFSSKTQCIRRMWSLSNSVIVIDEVQTVPKKLLYMFNLSLDFLADFCGCTILLCSATQPCLEAIDFPIHITENCNIVSPCDEIDTTFRRTQAVDMTDKPMTCSESALFAWNVLSDVGSLLIICNTKKSALDLYKYISEKNDDSVKIFHLSTNMCMKHRQDTISEITKSLENSRSGGKKVICVSTQLVEAGVDFSFESLIRVRAGLDNIAQASGRCNRGNEYKKLCNVYIIRLTDESISKLEDIRLSQEAVDDFLLNFKADTEKYRSNMLSEAAVNDYYRLLYKRHINKLSMEYPIKHCEETLFGLLSQNQHYKANMGEYYLPQAFRTAGDNFCVFDDNTTDIIVPYNDEAKKIIADLNDEKAQYDMNYLKKLLCMAKPYTVSVFDYTLKKLDEIGMLHTDKSKRFTYLDELAFDKNFGLKTEETTIC